MLSEPFSSPSPPTSGSVSSEVGDFEVVNLNPTPENLAEQAHKTLTSAKKVMNTKPVEDALRRLISQSQIIISTIPQSYKNLARGDLQYYKKQKFPVDMKKAIREQRKNIAKLQALCDEPLKQQQILSMFNPKQYKEAITLCKLFTPILTHYDTVLMSLFFGDATAIIQTYEISHKLDDISRKLPTGGKKRRTHKKRKTHKKRRTNKKHRTNKKRRTRKRRGGLSSVQMLEEIKKELRGNISNKEYQCLIRNSVIEKFINKQIRLGWNYTPGELSGIILRENTNC